jgi:hypothetical protein
MHLAHFERREFIDSRWDWNRGEHAFFCEPTQQGKSFLIWQLLQKVIADHEGGKLSVATLMPKPADPATRQWAEALNLAETPTWPPAQKWPWQDKPAGHVVWPRHDPALDAKANRKQIASILRRALHDQYWRGNSLTVGDDSHILAVLMELNPEIEEHLTAGGGMGSALWLANQKPSGSQSTGSLTTFAYSAPTHLFFGHDPDERNLKRLAEIGGVNPDEVAGIVRDLPVHRIMTAQGPKNVSDKLYCHKLGYMCTVGL